MDRLPEGLPEGSRRKQFGPHFDDLVDVLAEEILVAFGMRYFGADLPVPALDEVRSAAVMIADGVDEFFDYAPKRRGQS